MSMFDVTRVSADIGDSQISFETGKLAKQASGAVVVRSGDTMVLCTATVGNLRDVDFLPLTVDIEERMYAAGKIPGSFFRREGKSSEKATLTARMIDRPIRPLFPKGWHYETQLVAIPMSVDQVHPYDILAMNGASAALAISPVPVAKHVGAVRVGKLDGEFVVNPDEEDHEELDLDLIVAGTDDGGHDLGLVAVALGERRAQRPVDQAAGQDGLVARATLAAEERAGDLADGVGLLLDVDRQGEEVDAVAGLVVAVGGDEGTGVPDAGDDGALRLRGEDARLEGQGLVRAGDRRGHGDGVSHGVSPLEASMPRVVHRPASSQSASPRNGSGMKATGN